MSVETWQLIVGAIGITVTVLVAVSPWLFMVHAKLAVLTMQMDLLSKKVDRIVETEESRGPTLALHEQRIGLLEHQLRDLLDKVNVRG